MGEFDLNTLRVDGEIFESGEKKSRIQKYPDTCGRGLTLFTEIDQKAIVLAHTHQVTSKTLRRKRETIKNRLDHSVFD